MEEIQFYLDEAKESMESSINHAEKAFLKIRAGKASPNMLIGIRVDYYGAATPIEQVASINTTDARTIVIKPWEKGIINEIERSIINSDLGLNPQNDGDIIRLSVPPLTEERRKDLVKQARTEAEKGRISIRNSRKDTNNELKKLDGASEDAVKAAEEEVQKFTDASIKKLDASLAKKEEEIMTV